MKRWTMRVGPFGERRLEGAPTEPGEVVEVMPVAEYERLRAAALAVVDQDRGTDEGEEAFETAVHRLWMELHA